ncbi:MAG: hypothetical protein ACTH1Y_03405, partial [Lactococcus lactis]
RLALAQFLLTNRQYFTDEMLFLLTKSIFEKFLVSSVQWDQRKSLNRWVREVSALLKFLSVN